MSNSAYICLGQILHFSNKIESKDIEETIGDILSLCETLGQQVADKLGVDFAGAEQCPSLHGDEDDRIELRFRTDDGEMACPEILAAADPDSDWASKAS